tara:strand:- start:1573 stop:1749 length:177 start_codon:yes stop_codon:yes gene_type:complete
MKHNIYSIIINKGENIIYPIFKVKNELDLFNQLDKFKSDNCIYNDQIIDIQLLVKNIK